MRDDERLRGQTDNLFKAFRIDVGKIDQDAEPFAFTDEVAPKSSETIARRATRRKNAAAARGIAPCVGQSNYAHTQFVKNAQQIQVLA